MRKAIRITVIVVAVCTVVFFAIGFISLAVHPDGQSPTSSVASGGDFVSLAMEAVAAESYEDEPITDVAIVGRDLRVSVDMSGSSLNGYRDDETVLGEMLRGKSDHYAEAVLALGEQYDELWDTITIDFGELGWIVNRAEDVQMSDSGERYFPSWNYEIEH